MKKLIQTCSILLILVFMLTFFGCGSKEYKEYKFTHEDGNVSSISLNLEDLTGTYEGYPLSVVIRNGLNFKKESGATQTCSGVLIQSSDEDFSNWYTFKTDYWSIELIVDDDNSIRCRINEKYYTFNSN